MVTKEGKGEGDKLTHFYTLFPGGSDGKASACNAGDSGSIPALALFIFKLFIFSLSIKYSTAHRHYQFSNEDICN